MNSDSLCGHCKMQIHKLNRQCNLCSSDVCTGSCSEICISCQQIVCKKNIWECHTCEDALCDSCLEKDQCGWVRPECGCEIVLCKECQVGHRVLQCESCGIIICSKYTVDRVTDDAVLCEECA